MTTIGILSDTHQTFCDPDFTSRVGRAFHDCQVLIHAGDLTDLAILKAFAGKEVYAVHGNMCSLATQHTLPEKRTIVIDGFSIGICHGAGNRHNIEDRMLSTFPTADCIVFGHTHRPVCHRVGGILMINPGSFQSTGRYGSQGSYAILRLAPAGLSARLHDLSLP